MDYLIKNKPELAETMLGMPHIRDKYMGELIKTELGSDKQFRTEVSTMRTDEKTGRMCRGVRRAGQWADHLRQGR